MILGIGIDVVHVSRMRHWQEVEGLFDRFFHPSELAESLERGASAVLSLAARFAAKEAFGKALGTGLRGLSLKEILVESARSGKPEIKLFGRARSAMEAMGGRKAFISLTHETDSAIAVVVIEGEDGKRS